ncbi:BCD family MFS transporter [Variovorax sp. J22R133]|uniref:BCD family MFS transporter n=1 Tax=Variovorax brevis TaxID=3053503 RepID=UPI0025769AF4|nr:BCD family MFS transporter [Variovorax sp. J22R133]MDM0113809.1 BCD family MFS transporter [Variovorax sp. J22R133]
MNPVIRLNNTLASKWSLVATRFLPFADVATRELPLGRLMRLSLFQVTVGMALALLNGTLNRVMIVELHVPAWLVAVMVGLPLVFAPFRALVGFRSDHHRSALGWKRVPFIWMGTLLQFGGLAIMPFALIVLSGDTNGPPVYGQIGAALAFLLVGAGLHTTQTAGLALATDLATPENRPRVVALLYGMLLLGTFVSALAFGALLENFQQLRLIKVVQGAAVVTMVLNLIALWKQEARQPRHLSREPGQAAPVFRESWRAFVRGGRAARLLVAVGLGSAAFSMQDVLLEPYGGEIMHMDVSSTTTLTAMIAAGALAAFVLAARWFHHGGEEHRLGAIGALVGIFAFAGVIFANPMGSPLMFRMGTTLIGFGGGLFSVATLTAAMNLENGVVKSGLALGAWGAVQASCSGVAIALGGALRDAVSSLAEHGALGPAVTGPAIGYSAVYYLEIVLLFATLMAIGPLVRRHRGTQGATQQATRFGLAEFPG